ncbi:MAG TPA: ATP-dependent DNA ligase [Candidatus Baltobacteraceae bacterium]|nr:ATP-dependent DNA ligase [Candidatus Baltobacteraceae bacterium]
MIAFARTCAAIAATASKLEKIAILAAYFRELDDANLAAAARFFTGNAFAAREQKQLSIGASAIVEAAQYAWGVTDAQLRAGYREHGDLGAALGPFVREPHDLGLFREPLTPASLGALFEEIAAAAGRSARKHRLHLCERILGACSDPLEATYVIKIMTGDLRIGLRAGLVDDAIAAAFGLHAPDVRRAVMIAGDVGAVAVAAKHGDLSSVRIRYGSPIGFMLASPIPYGEIYRDLTGALWHAEDKYDGIRAQAHVEGARVTLFSRTLNDVTHSYPEIAQALHGQSHRMMLDGEIIAMREGQVLPFRMLQARLQRKEIDAALLAEVPLQYVAFDMMAIDDEFLLDVPLRERRARLAEAVAENAHLRIAPFETLEPDAGPETINARFEAARARGNEGAMFKRADSPYAPGRRGKWWLKLKRELDTLDVVVVAVEWGHGKRAKVLSDYTFAVRGEHDELLTIGKAYSGLTDAEIAALTPRFLEHALPAHAQREKARSHEIPVEPEIVLEVAFDIIQESDLHESGFSLRFPRIVRIRDDKPPADIDTIARVREIYAAMLERERVHS